MEDSATNVDHIEDIVMKESQSSSGPPNDGNENLLPPVDLEKVHTSQNNRHKREISVDMLASGERLPLENSKHGVDVALANNSHTTSNGVTLTPQSAMSASSFATSPVYGASSAGSPFESFDRNVPSIDDQITQVTKMASASMEDGQKSYIVASKWLSRVRSRGTEAQKTGKQDKAAMDGEIGPVDNSGINLVMDPTLGELKDEHDEPFVPLKPGLQISEDFEILPQNAWELITKWYGLAPGSPVITRYCHNTSTSETINNLQFELYPPILTILKLPYISSGFSTNTLLERGALPVRLVASQSEPAQNFLKRAKYAANIAMRTKVRLWKINSDLGETPQAGMLTPAQSRSASPVSNGSISTQPWKSLSLDVNTFLRLEIGSQRELIDMTDQTTNVKYNGQSTLGLVGLTQEGINVLEERIGGPGGGEWVSDYADTDDKSNGVAISITKNGTTTAQDKLKPRVNVSNGRTSPASSSGGMMTRGRAQKNGRARGTVGLANLGNTCYMNSALQCVRSVEELTHYFLQDQYKKELNPRNPLAHNGEVAKAYSGLLREVYAENTFSSISPRHFKQIIGKYGPSFSGYGQQDSQEFLLFLLDGLQEDLNRVQKKPYIEKPDSTDEMVSDHVALCEMADKCWDIYKARNDSVITDLFAGMYKSTVICPVCDKVSIIFDPFNNLTLQLPIENLWTRTIYFLPLYDRPIKVSVELDKNASIFALKEYVAQKFGTDARKTVVTEVYKNRLFKTFDDDGTVGEARIADTDYIAIHELEDIPTNFPAPMKKTVKHKSMLHTHSDDDDDLPEIDSPLAEKMLVTVFNRVAKEGSSKSQQKTFFGLPSCIVLNREEARDYDMILRKVLAKVNTMTTMDLLKQDEESDTQSARNEDSDTVLTTMDDADSSSDSKVHAHSVQSEDGMVDISMRGADEVSQTDSQIDSYISYPSRLPRCSKLPRMLQPEAFLIPEVRNLFEMQYYSGKEMVPIGWNSLSDENKVYPRIDSRIPQPIGRSKRAMLDERKRNLRGGDSSTSSDEDIEDVGHDSTAFNAEESDEDGLPPVRSLDAAIGALSRSNRRTSRRKKGLITYSNKGKRSTNSRSDESTKSVVDQKDAPLIRLGEAIILDWDPTTYESLFYPQTQSEDAGIRGTPTWEHPPLLSDPELDRKRQLRTSRRKNGVSLGDCLDEFGKAEILSENDAWYCPRCKEHRRASKKFELWKSPDILVIHLKRFSAQGRFRDKLDALVDFPIEGLDLSSRVAIKEDGKSPIYDLFAVDNHYGGLGGGHYTAFARNFFDGNWYEYNDSQASRRSDPQVVVTPAAYLLFYRRRSSNTLGGPLLGEMIEKAYEASVESPTEPQSRVGSPSAPAGEGQRLDGYSRNGSSSALQGVGAVHQVGGGGLADGTLTMAKLGNDDYSLPSYSNSLHDGEQTLETLEGIDPSLSIQQAQTATWGFESIPHIDDGNNSGYGSLDGGFDHNSKIIQVPHGSEGDTDEDLFEDASTRALSSPGGSDRGRLEDFGDEERSSRMGTPAIGIEPEYESDFSDHEVPPPLSELMRDSRSMLGVRLQGLSGYNSEAEEEAAEIRVEDEELIM